MLKKILSTLALAAFILQGTPIHTQPTAQETFESLKTAIHNAAQEGAFGVLTGKRTKECETFKVTQYGRVSYEHRYWDEYHVQNPEQDTRNTPAINELATKCAKANVPDKEKEQLWALLLTRCMERKFKCEVEGVATDRLLTPHIIYEEMYKPSWKWKMLAGTVIPGLVLPALISLIPGDQKGCEDASPEFLAQHRKDNFFALTMLAVLAGVGGHVLSRTFIHKDVSYHNWPVLKNMELQLFDLTSTFEKDLPASLSFSKIKTLFMQPQPESESKARALANKQHAAFVGYFQKVSSIASKIE